MIQKNVMYSVDGIEYRGILIAFIGTEKSTSGVVVNEAGEVKTINIKLLTVVR